MDNYDKIIAKAYEVAEKDGRRKELESNFDSGSDSELPLLTSSIFNGMEGIE